MTAPGLGKHISAVIMFKETLYQKTAGACVQSGRSGSQACPGGLPGRPHKRTRPPIAAWIVCVPRPPAHPPSPPNPPPTHPAGKPFVECLREQGIQPGIKVDEVRGSRGAHVAARGSASCRAHGSSERTG